MNMNPSEGMGGGRAQNARVSLLFLLPKRACASLPHSLFSLHTFLYSPEVSGRKGLNPALLQRLGGKGPQSTKADRVLRPHNGPQSRAPPPPPCFPSVLPNFPTFHLHLCVDSGATSPRKPSQIPADSEGRFSRWLVTALSHKRLGTPRAAAP